MISNYVGVLRKYAVFGGRATRAEYRLFALAQVIIEIGLGALAAIALFGGLPVPFVSLVLVIFILYLLCTLLPGLGVTVRRFHDGGYSGWMMLLGLIPPPIGGIVALIFMALPSERGDNEYGPDPRVKARPPYRPRSGAKTWAGHPGYAGWDGSRFGNGDATFL